MSAAPQLFEKLLTIPARSRQGSGTLRSRLFGTDKAKKEGQILRTSLAIHRPVWVTAGGATYATMAPPFIPEVYRTPGRFVYPTLSLNVYVSLSLGVPTIEYFDHFSFPLP
ncbi:hypothetical protein DTO166G4_2907 [Paecilomyces variotii]|nr:hypothetical protein DTO166G4_2907 [Paecilomyces variotii]KAJ9221036.1 hypothetical protein DTO169C6_6557 [Paecilomyces variotii]KAJ9233217.1 hypothetical protein DTO166G5_5805 [Paecilomyces variotii]KAJ9244886.1 hypothetical protein DTO169E5_1267 [Paecilomyces variotii]KAJ9257490.1 hypothetical protein DTO195F2_5472 [Paecilomyces variotii]